MDRAGSCLRRRWNDLGINTCQAYTDLERELKRVLELQKKINEEWQVMLRLEIRDKRIREMARISEEMRNPIKPRN